jgi:hypothetical protein
VKTFSANHLIFNEPILEKHPNPRRRAREHPKHARKFDPNSPKAIKLASFGKAFRGGQKRKSTPPPDARQWLPWNVAVEHFRLQEARRYQQSKQYPEPTVKDHRTRTPSHWDS